MSSRWTEDALRRAGASARAVTGPPWILGLRGSPLEAPENTRIGLARALEIGLDGVAYELAATRDGELVLARPAVFERPADIERSAVFERGFEGAGPIAERLWRELAELDAGGWFGARFRGTPLCLFEEALALPPAVPGARGRGPPQHVLVPAETVDLAQVARIVRELAPHSSVRVALPSADACLEARALGLVPLWIPETAGPREADLVARERLPAFGAPSAAWDATEPGSFDCERWVLDAHGPAELLRAMRGPFHAVWTAEPVRALAVRALARLAPGDDGAFPVEAPELALEPSAARSARAGVDAASRGEGLRGAWWGSWTPVARVRNPFPFAVRVTVGLLPRRGAFEIRGLPVARELEPGAAFEVPFALTGGARSPGGDPLLFTVWRWKKGPGRAAGRLLLDAPLRRVRTARADALPVRLELLREAPGEAPASMVLRRARGSLLVSVERPGGARAVEAVVVLDGRLHRGGRGLRVRLPSDFDRRPGGVPFACGFVGMLGRERVLRRWSGGLPDELEAGAAGRLLPLQVARGSD